jgi:hypothetical protein
MKETVRDPLLMHLRRVAVAVLAIGVVAAGAVHANPSNTVVVPPTHLPLITSLGLTLPGLISDAGHSSFTVAGPTMDAPPTQGFGPIDTVLTYELNRLFDVKQVRAQMTRTDTGTTSMPTESGLCLIRRPTVEWIHQLKEISAN